MSKSKIKRCLCSNSFQDEKYGKGMRVHNQTNKKIADKPLYRCTVRLLEKT